MPTCPVCGGQLFCVDSSGVWWRCYSHGEGTYDMSGDEVARREAANLRDLSASNAAAIRSRSAR